MIVQARWSLDPCADCRSATPGRRGLGSGRASRNGADEQPTATALHVFFAPAGLLCGDQFPTDRARPFSPRKRRPPCEHPLSYSSCWTFLLGTALLAPSRVGPSSMCRLAAVAARVRTLIVATCAACGVRTASMTVTVGTPT